MTLDHKWDVKNGFAFVLQFFSFISDYLGGVLDLTFTKKISNQLGIFIGSLVAFLKNLNFTDDAKFLRHCRNPSNYTLSKKLLDKVCIGSPFKF